MLESTGEEEIRAASVRFTKTLLGADHAALFISDPKSGDLRLESGLGWAPGVVGTVAVAPSNESFAGYAFLHKVAIQVEDLAEERALLIAGVPRASTAFAPASWCRSACVRSRSGVLAAYYQTAHRFSEEENRVLTASRRRRRSRSRRRASTPSSRRTSCGCRRRRRSSCRPTS